MSGSEQKSLKDLLDRHFDIRSRDFIHTSFPARIVNVNNNNTVNVEPLVMTKMADGSQKPYPIIYDVRLHTYAAASGEVFVSLPIGKGDLVWVFASERDTARLMGTDGTKPQPSETQITHSLSDCFAIPAFYPDKKSRQFDPDNLVIENKGTQIVVKDGEVVIDADHMNIKSNLVDIDGTLNIKGDLSITGSVSQGDVDIGSSHTHSGVQAGSDISGPVSGSSDGGGGTNPSQDIARLEERTTTTVVQVGGGNLVALRTNEIHDGSTYTLPLANSVSVDQFLFVFLPDEFSTNTPTIQVSGSDLIEDINGTDTSVIMDSGAITIGFVSDGISRWRLIL